MFDKSVVETDHFIELPVSSKALYFLLGLEADDDGFVTPRKTMRLHGASLGDIQTLISKGFLIPFETGVVVITHWHMNNWLDSRRSRPTQYQKELKSLALTLGGKYELSIGLERVEETRREYTNARKLAGRIISNKTPMLKYNESDPSDSYEPAIDSETREAIGGEKNKTGGFKQMLDWAVNRRGVPFLNIPRQYAAMKKLQQAGITKENVMARWKEMETEEFWKKTGLDFPAVFNNFDRKGK